VDDNNNNNNNEDINDDIDVGRDDPGAPLGEPDDGFDADLPEIKPTQTMLDAEYFNMDDAAEPKTRFAEKLFDLIDIVSGAFLIVILVFTFVLRIVTVHGPSMQETLHDKDMLLISHLLLNPKPGDIIVIQVPNPQYDTPIIKRVVAIEGQTVDFDFANWTVIVDGEPIDEPYVNFDYLREYGSYVLDENGEKIFRTSMTSSDIRQDLLPITIGPGKVFVMGDNRNQSSDSRSASIGQVDTRDIVGRVMVRVWPFNKLGIVKPNEEE